MAVQEELAPWIERVIDLAIARALKAHVAGCPLLTDTRMNGMAGRIQKLEIRYAALLAFMIGSGVIGGGVVASVFKLLGGS